MNTDSPPHPAATVPAMPTWHDPEPLWRACADWAAAGQSLAFVPTMGNLHAGHLALIAAARREAPRVVASLFVNPLQFGPGEDWDRYPRTLARDREQLAAAGCDGLFAPSVETLYPHGQAAHTRVEVPELSDILCGANRPGHFVGVATVVCKLLNLVRPRVAIFGEKDFQQLLVIRRMVEDLALPVRILGVPTVREADGLALSSRNGYLNPSERAQAPELYRALTGIREALRQGEPVPLATERALGQLRDRGWQPDYISVRRVRDLRPPRAGDAPGEWIVLAAARLGQTRLIDNLRLGEEP